MVRLNVYGLCVTSAKEYTGYYELSSPSFRKQPKSSSCLVTYVVFLLDTLHHVVGHRRTWRPVVCAPEMSVGKWVSFIGCCPPLGHLRCVRRRVTGDVRLKLEACGILSLGALASHYLTHSQPKIILSSLLVVVYFLWR